jgi:hypothetical protein
MENIRKVLSAMLVVSSVIGLEILAIDKWLWFAEPVHAYGLAVFIGFGGVLAAALWRRGRTRLAVLGAILLAVVQFTAMVGDLIVGQPTGVASEAFRSYLLGNTWFLTLLVVQVAVLVLAIRASKLSFRLHLRPKQVNV